MDTRGKVRCKAVVSLLAGALVATTLFSTTDVYASGVSQQRLNQLQEQHQQRSQVINQLSQQESTISNQIGSLDQQVKNYDSKIQDLEVQINASNDKIDALETEINNASAEFEKRNELLKERVRVMYEAGSVSYLDVLFKATDFSDFIDRISALTFIVNQDKKLLEEVKQMKTRLLDSQEQLKEEQAQQQDKRNELMAAKKDQEQAKKEREAALGQVQTEKQSQEQLYKSEEDEIAAVSTEIAAAISPRLNAAAADSQNSQVAWGNGSWLWPLPSSRNITSPYGPRDGGFHDGIDIAAPLGSPIVAVADGEVLFAGSASGFGNWIVIRHPNGLMSVYGHMYSSGVLVSPGQKVKRGQVIAKVGNAGISSGPHLQISAATGISGGRLIYIDPTPLLK